MLMFVHMLARDLGKTVSELLHMISWREFRSWALFYAREVEGMGGAARGTRGLQQRARRMSEEVIGLQGGR